jgi:hypothetical protein
MSRWLITLVLTVAPAAVWAQPARPAVTAKAHDDLRGLESRVVQLGGTRTALAKQYAVQLEAIDRLKKQRASWRQQRELRTSLTDANDTATRLAAATNELAKANTALAAARRQLQLAVDAELSAGATGARATELARLKAQLAPQTPKRVSRIVLPDTEIDPLADPEELDEQAKQLRDAEEQLRKQIQGLEKQSADLDEVAKLRKQHDRAGELSRRDDDQPQRTATQGGGGSRTSFEDSGAAPEAAGPQNGGGGSTGLGTGGTGAGIGSFEADATIVLADVIDASTIETLTRAQRTGDPAQRALAAKKARDAVAGRLEQLKKKRAEIEALAKSRRGRR